MPQPTVVMFELHPRPVLAVRSLSADLPGARAPALHSADAKAAGSLRSPASVELAARALCAHEDRWDWEGPMAASAQDKDDYRRRALTVIRSLNDSTR